MDINLGVNFSMGFIMPLSCQRDMDLRDVRIGVLMRCCPVMRKEVLVLQSFRC